MNSVAVAQSALVCPNARADACSTMAVPPHLLLYVATADNGEQAHAMHCHRQSVLHRTWPSWCHQHGIQPAHMPPFTAPSPPCPPGVVVAADSADGQSVDADNKSYATRLVAREAAGRSADGEAQTPAPLRKQKDAQSGGGGCQVAACQASGWEIEDAYAALERQEEEGDEEGVLGSVLPAGGAVATGEGMAGESGWKGQ